MAWQEKKILIIKIQDYYCSNNCKNNLYNQKYIINETKKQTYDKKVLDSRVQFK